ncbi:MAG: hypothetical protein HY817_02845 [Candidatus Abawacabacteria bacterium]|nr:hypothetical protein [Candidatus Abawacabacteria bacterium]
MDGSRETPDISFGKLFAEGSDHRVYENLRNPSELLKVPKVPGDINNIRELLDMSRKLFAPFIPPARVLPDKTAGYIIGQARIPHARHVRPADIATSADVRKQIDSLLQMNRAAMAEHGVSIDPMGLAGAAQCLLSEFKPHRDKVLDKLLVTPGIAAGLILRNRGLFPLMPQEAPTWWRDPDLTPAIANIVITPENGQRSTIHLVDFSLIRLRSANNLTRLRAQALHQWNRFWLGRCFDLSM